MTLSRFGHDSTSVTTFSSVIAEIPGTPQQMTLMTLMTLEVVDTSKEKGQNGPVLGKTLGGTSGQRSVIRHSVMKTAP